MRFSVRDMLMLMVFVAVAATITHYAVRDLALEDLARALPLGCFIAVVLVSVKALTASIAKSKLGETIADLPDEMFHRSFLLLSAALAGGYLFALLLSRLHPVFNSLFIALPLYGVYQWFTTRKVTIGTQGLFGSGQFVPWGELCLMRNESTAKLRWRNHHKTYPVHISLTPTLVEQIELLIAALREA